MVEGIAILGSHPMTVMRAPFEKNWRIYACSPHNFEHRTLPRVDAWFEVHIPAAHQTRAYGYLKCLEKVEYPVYMRDLEAMKHFPTAVQYPEAELRGVGETNQYGQVIVKELGKFSYFAFTSSIAYIMAKALDDCDKEGIKEIGLWGIMQASQTEYAYQKPGIQYFIDRAWRRGVKVTCPTESNLFEPQPENF